MFITLEGIDGVGKTTQARLLVEYLLQQGYDVVHTFEPGGTSLGQAIRKLLLDPENHQLEPVTEILLYAADRAQHVAEVIRPALAEGKVVVCERYIDSSVAYQGYGLDLSVDMIVAVNKLATAGLEPDLTICLDAEPQTVLARVGGDRIEQRDLAYHERVRSAFLSIAAQNPQRVVVVSAEGTEWEVSQRVQRSLAGRLA
ncbi:MAG: dTMP kinase [Firmicutes bacterium]|nr:dTMP kinase [Bacillota bacterium]